MILFTSKELSEILKIDIKAELEIDEVIIDSRKAAPNRLFIGLNGDNFNGGDFADQALAAGAALAIVDCQAKVAKDKRIITVPDTFIALKAIANFARNRTSAKIIGITGSVGKTTTKEIAKQVFAKLGRTYASAGNFNNHFGLPLCLSNMPHNAEFAILEMGMSSPGEIHNLSIIVKPDIAIITNVEVAHLQYFENMETIAAAKAEIFDGMQAGSTAIINFDNHYRYILQEAAVAKGLKVLGFGQANDANAQLTEYSQSDTIAQIKFSLEGHEYFEELGILGEHQAKNTIAVFLAAYALTGRIPHNVLKEFQAQDGRGKVIEKNGITIIDDAYNASPASVKAALTVFKNRTAKRKIAVLGDMRELGKEAASMHIDLLSHIIDAEVSQVFLVGELMHHLWNTLPENLKGGYTAEYSAMIPLVEQFLKAGDLVLFKGSNSTKINKIVDALLA